MHEETRRALIAASSARQEQARRDAEQLGDEVLTQKACANLFGVTEAAVRAAVRDNRVRVEFRVSSSLAGRRLAMLALGSAVECWTDRQPSDIDARLEEMRRDCMVMAMPFGPDDDVVYRCYNILHTERMAAGAFPADDD